MTTTAPPDRRYSTGYNGTTRTRAELLAWSHMQGLDTELREPVLWTLDAAHNLGHPVGIGSIVRDEDAADDLFRSRYYVVPVWVPGAVSFEGKWWKLRPGYAPAMPSDRTYHVKMTPSTPKYALAIDFTGHMPTLAQLLPRVFMIEFSKVNGEPWHGQGDSYPQSRSRFVASLHYPLPKRTLPPLPGNVGTIVVEAPAPTLKQRGRFGGTNNEGEVREWQHACNWWGFRDAIGWNLLVDGKFGAKTDQATRNAQRRLNELRMATPPLVVDGIYGPKTAQAFQRFLNIMVDLAA